jgi:CHC2 zinc finger
MAENLERLKQRIPLLEYLQRHNWKPCRAGACQEFVGLCPLHPETRPSFYVNAAKNLFYCHGCGRGGDLIRFVQIFLDLPFRQTVTRSATPTNTIPPPANRTTWSQAWASERGRLNIDRVILVARRFLPAPLVGRALACGDLVEGAPLRFHPHVGVLREHGARDVPRDAHDHLVASVWLRKLRD